MKRLNCEKCGDIPEALLDGYPFGERILEGVLFKVSIVRGKIKAVFAEPEDHYVKGLAKKWQKEASEFADGYDNFECPTCKGEVAMLEDIAKCSECGAPVPVAGPDDIDAGVMCLKCSKAT